MIMAYLEIMNPKQKRSRSNSPVLKSPRKRVTKSGGGKKLSLADMPQKSPLPEKSKGKQSRGKRGASALAEDVPAGDEEAIKSLQTAEELMYVVRRRGFFCFRFLFFS